MATKLGKVITYHEGLQPIKAYDSLRGLFQSHDKIKTLYLHYQSAYGHQTRKDGNLPWSWKIM